MDQRKYCLHQAELIKKEKWIEGERLGRDPGPDFVTNWVKENAKRYREEYEKTYKTTVTKTAEEAIARLRTKLPKVPEEQWEIIVKEVIDSFVEVWTQELVYEESEERRLHLEEI